MPPINVQPEIADMPLAAIVPAPYNPRTISDPAYAGLQESLQKFGYIDLLVVNKRTSRLIAGHQRLKILLAQGVAAAPVILVDLDDAAEQMANVTLNSQQIAGTWSAALAPLLQQLQADNPDDFLKLRLDALYAEIAQLDQQAPDPGLTDPDAIPAPPKVPITHPGDLWFLGEHSLLCGDSTNPDHVARLMAGEKADFIFTDPPYGHNNNDGDLINNMEKALGRHDGKLHPARPILNDSPADAARLYTAFLHLANDFLRGGGCCCCCCCGGGGPDPQFARWSLEMDQIIGFKMAVVWSKPGLGLGWHYRRNYEFILVAEKPGAPCHWYGGNDVPNVISDIAKIIPTADQHPTEKPVALPAFFIPLHSKPGEIILDPFLGSGTTLIAAQQLARRCYALEIEPLFVDVAVARWEQFTGQKATREKAPSASAKSAKSVEKIRRPRTPKKA